MNVDWRNRFGWNWISSVRSQGSCQNCWAFAVTALVEAMVRIEHCVWCRRSEGDLARGTGKQCWDLGNLGEAAIFAERYGIADPDCFPWSEAASLYTAKPHGANLSALPLSPTPDRIGRTVRLPTSVSITDINSKKQWIDQVGPLAVMFTPPADFGALGSDIYVPTTQVLGTPHALLVVGYNDDENYWIAKNSWGPGWGQGGFGKISYSSNLLEPVSFLGVRNTNSDPWTKRRLHNGAFFESGNGLWHNNFELFIKRGMTIEHWWRENGSAGFPWSRAGVVRSTDQWRDTFYEDALDCPAVIQSTFNRNYELVYRSTYKKLRHVYFDQASGQWYDATLFGPTDPTGIPGFIQSTRGAPGDFEVVVLTLTGFLEHWTKHNSLPWDTHRPGEWYFQEQFGGAIALASAALVQSRLNMTGELEGNKGELHYVSTGVDAQMYHFRRPVGGSWVFANKFGTGITSAPCMIEGQFGAANELDVGNFELCVGTNDHIEHWWKDNHSSGPWNRSAVFGTEVRRVVGLLEGSFGFNLELIADRTDGRYQHYWRDSQGWHSGQIIV